MISSQEISELDFNEFADETLESMLTELEVIQGTLSGIYSSWNPS